MTLASLHHFNFSLSLSVFFPRVMCAVTVFMAVIAIRCPGVISPTRSFSDYYHC